MITESYDVNRIKCLQTVAPTGVNINLNNPQISALKLNQ